MNSAVTNMAVMMGAMQIAKRIPFDEQPQFLLYARIVYISAQVICLLINYFISLKVRTLCCLHQRFPAYSSSPPRLRLRRLFLRLTDQEGKRPHRAEICLSQVAHVAGTG